ncbi:hypothetical protein HZA56_16665 [Candidatus Poribacteria bacterium]|nr:hypothetical protein [Candidatus Poribacteria bacterium]
MSYEQTVEVRTSDGALIRLFDFMGFAVTESRLGKNKKIILCVPFIDGQVAVLESGKVGLLDIESDPVSEEPSAVTMIAKILEVNERDHDLLVNAGVGDLYVIPDGDVSAFKVGDIVKFKAQRLDLLEILE